MSGLVGEVEQGRPLDLAALRIGALLNTSSGRCPVGAEREMEAILLRHGLELSKAWCGGGDQISAALDEASAHKLDLLIVLGGDGTIRSAAEACAASGPLLIALPGGTMNMLPKALYGDVTWQAALEATLADPVAQSVSGGHMGDKPFFVAAIVGDPALWADVREAVREGDLAHALSKGSDALAKTFQSSLRYRFGETSGEAQAVSILCPLTSQALAADEMALEVAAITPDGALGAIRLAFHSLVSGWRSDPAVTTAKTRAIVLEADEPIRAVLDGESQVFGRSVNVVFAPRAFNALIPGTLSR
ncbi:diacylglycerol kinase family protein [Caulobacter sp. S45]|uniref:diacylglycerol/lipid kinase family protein n=1 Tax=Caulobacter sp. S45 TaxID=1641861 RepID=UPI00131A6BF4|nr:diacylglycerol kinase family protein [Caulobacter sp. S45]